MVQFLGGDHCLTVLVDRNSVPVGKPVVVQTSNCLMRRMLALVLETIAPHSRIWAKWNQTGAFGGGALPLAVQSDHTISISRVSASSRTCANPKDSPTLTKATRRSLSSSYFLTSVGVLLSGSATSSR